MMIENTMNNRSDVYTAAETKKKNRIGKEEDEKTIKREIRVANFHVNSIVPQRSRSCGIRHSLFYDVIWRHSHYIFACVVHSFGCIAVRVSEEAEIQRHATYFFHENSM